MNHKGLAVHFMNNSMLYQFSYSIQYTFNIIEHCQVPDVDMYDFHSERLQDVDLPLGVIKILTSSEIAGKKRIPSLVAEVATVRRGIPCSL